MAVEHAIAALRDHWDDVAGRLGRARSGELRALVVRLGGAGHAAAVARIVELLTEELPPAHPVRRALSRGYLYTTAQPDWPALREGLLAVAGEWPAAAPDPAEAGPDEAGPDAAAGPASILAEVTARLLSAPAFTEGELRRRGADPADPGLLRLDRPDGGCQWPSFQFAPDGAPLPVVRTVNLMLDAEADPVGVADWWLGVNAWLDARPSELIGIVADEEIVRAARAVDEEV